MAYKEHDSPEITGTRYRQYIMHSVPSSLFVHTLYCTGNFVLNAYVYLIIGGRGGELFVICCEPKIPMSGQFSLSPKY